MRVKTGVIGGLLLFLLGTVTGVVLAKIKVDPKLLEQSPKAVSASLLTIAQQLAEDGSWENIAVGRVYYLGGERAKGQAIFDRILGSKKAAAGDYLRIGRVYWEAGQWDKAKSMFDKTLELKPEDEDWLAEIGTYYNLKGDHAHAQELFDRSLKRDASNLYNTLKMAGSYLGVSPG